MLRIHRLSCLIVLLLITPAFSAEPQKGETLITYPNELLSKTDPLREVLPWREIVPEGAFPIYQISRNERIYSSSTDDNLVYRVRAYPVPQPQGPAKAIGEDRQPAVREFKCDIVLLKIPSTTDSQEIRQKYLDIAIKDYEKKLQDYQNDREKQLKASLSKRQNELLRAEKEIKQLTLSKAETEKAIQKNQFKTDILGYLYKEKVKLDLDRLEQRAKLDAITQCLDRIAALEKERDDISKTMSQLQRDSRSSELGEEERATIQNRISELNSKWASLRKSLASPENAMPKEQLADAKIAQIATDRRFQEVEKLISQYEQSEKSAADLTKINSQLDVQEKMRKDALTVIKRYESDLERFKTNPVRVISKAEYDAEQSKKAEKEENTKESKPTPEKE